MSNLDKLRAKNKAAQEMKAQNQAKKSENLVDDIIQSGISYEEASGDDSQNVNQKENQNEKNTEEIVKDVINEKIEEDEKKVLATESPERVLNDEERNNVSMEAENTVEPPLNASEGKMAKRTAKEATKGRRNTKTSEEQQTIKAAISLVASKKENKSVRKSFLIKESSNEKLKILADQLGTSENDVINQILESVLSDVE